MRAPNLCDCTQSHNYLVSKKANLVRKLIRFILALCTIILFISLLALFVWPPALNLISPQVCPQNSMLVMQPSPTHFKNVVFTCINLVGEGTDATIALFRYLCFSVLIPYLFIMVMLMIIYFVVKNVQGI